MVNIRKLKTNYEIRYQYSKLLTEFIKTFPREHQRTRVDNVVMPDGSSSEAPVMMPGPSFFIYFSPSCIIDSFLFSDVSVIQEYYTPW